MDAVAVANRQISVTMPEAHGVAGESIIVPVNVDSTDGLAGGDISIYYDQTVLRAVDVSLEPGVLLASSLSDPGMVRIAFANINGVSGKTLAGIRFDVLGYKSGGRRSYSEYVPYAAHSGGANAGGGEV